MLYPTNLMSRIRRRPLSYFRHLVLPAEPKLIPFSHRNMLVAAMQAPGVVRICRRKIAVLASALSFIRTG